MMAAAFQNVQEYINTNTQVMNFGDFAPDGQTPEEYFKQTVAGGSYFPTELDPEIPNTVLYGRAPVLTRIMNMPGMLKPTSTTVIKYLKHTSTFQSEWISDTDEGSDPVDQTLVPTTDNVRVLITKFSLSDLLNMGYAVDANIKEELIQMALETQRETLDSTLLTGNATTNPDEFNGLWTEVPSSNITDMQGETPTLSDLYNLETSLREDHMGVPTAIICSSAVLNAFRLEMQMMQRSIQQSGRIGDAYSGQGMLAATPVEVVAGVSVTAYESETGPIPFITTPWMPRTPGQRGLLMLDESNVKLREFATPYIVTLAKTMPVATTFSVVQMNLLYNKVPEKSMGLTNIA